MTTTTAVATAPKKNDLRALLQDPDTLRKFAEVAPKHMKVERLVRLMLSAVARNPKIAQCSKDSILLFCMKCSETGLEPIGPGGAWPIPYENKKAGTVELTFIPDYRGLVNCAKHAHCIKDAYAEVVREQDEFDYELGLAYTLKHKPARGDRGALEAAYCIITLTDDTKRFVVMDKTEIEGIRNRSQAWKAWEKYQKEGPWNTDPAEQWKKTVVRRAMKPYVGASQELDRAIAADDAATGINFTPEPIAMPQALPAKAEPLEVTDELAAFRTEFNGWSEDKQMTYNAAFDSAVEDGKSDTEAHDLAYARANKSGSLG